MSAKDVARLLLLALVVWAGLFMIGYAVQEVWTR